MHDHNVLAIFSGWACHLAKAYFCYLSLSEKVEYHHQPEDIGLASYDVTQQESYCIIEVDQCYDQWSSQRRWWMQRWKKEIRQGTKKNWAKKLYFWFFNPSRVVRLKLFHEFKGVFHYWECFAASKTNKQMKN